MSDLNSSTSSAFVNRLQAGMTLAHRLEQYANDPNAIVLALPRGGVPVGYEVASYLNLPLDIFLVRKLGVPGQEELAMGAIASGGVRVLNDSVIRALNIKPKQIEDVSKKELAELDRRQKDYRGNRRPPDFNRKTVILVDDGLATGFTMRAAVEALRQHQPAKIVVAVPVGAAETCQELLHIANEVICALAPTDFQAVGLWYENFEQLNDDDVRDLLARAIVEHNTHGLHQEQIH